MLVGRKSESSLEPGYVFVPYVMAQSVAVISEHDSLNIKRKKRINNIFELDLDIQNGFIPRKLVNSRYSTTNISNKYYVEIKKPTI